MKRAWSVAVLLSLIALPAFAGGVLRGGTDLWVTPADGSSWSDFSSNPIPAGFFCERSTAFTGRIAFKGAPLATDSPNVLRGADTIIERLDDAALDNTGKAETRLQVRALNLVSLAPLKTACGSYDVRASLVGDQPLTKMRIFQETETGGRYLAPLALNIRLTFTPVSRRGAALEMTQRIRFAADPRAAWTVAQNKASERYIRVDTNGDGRADTMLPAPSNFRPGALRSVDKLLSDRPYDELERDIDPDTGYSHTAPVHQHTTTPPPPPPGGGGGGGGGGEGGGGLLLPTPIEN